MNPIETELVLGFTRSNGEQTVSTIKGDTERFIHCTLVEDLLNYVVADDVNYVILKGVYSNGEIIAPAILSPTYSVDRTEMTFQVNPVFTQISGVAKCTIMFIKSTNLPEFDDKGNIISDNSRVLTSDTFRLYVQGDVLDDGCVSSTDTIAISSLVQFVVKTDAIIKELEDIEDNEDVRIENENRRVQAENVRLANETSRQGKEAVRVSAENVRQSNEAVREANEANREANEATRISAENSRVAAETARVTEFEASKNAADAATLRANTISADLENKVATNYYDGKDFDIAKIYSSIAEMNADYNNPDIPLKSFVIITSNVEDPDNAKLFIKGDSAYNFVTDMSGATGLQGPKGEQGEKGDEGTPGESISDISKTSTSGLTDTYTITTTDGNTYTFTVTNGADGAGSVSTVNNVPSIGGNVTLTPADLGLGNVDNTSDINKPISSATQIALNGKMNLIGGTSGQVIGFDADGNPEAQDSPSSSYYIESGYLCIDYDNIPIR